ncbi:MAG: formyltransferase family protein [Patescibacteria group bacterium]|nr:formyltransferase family protein [Patescibacteria group bacterium]MDD5294382.1 formyltransferase family protein [Patescibacteria group bacterium]MDD5554671.1 formyltransferase family protein [Patescibacteria group bacterium]
MKDNSLSKPKVLVFASGSKDGGGSGFLELVEFSRTTPPVLDAEIVGVVSNHSEGGVYKKAERLGVPFCHWSGPFGAGGYEYYVNMFRADYVMLSGWLKLVHGLDPVRTVNIHPGPLPEFGGPGMYGHHVHEAVMRAYREGKITQSAVTMHFVDERYDHGPIIFQLPVLIRPDDTPETLAGRVNEKERAWQSFILNLVVNGHIRLEGEMDNWQLIAEKKFTGEVPGFIGKYI